VHGERRTRPTVSRHLVDLLGHVLQVIAHDRARTADLLDDIAEVVDEEGQGRAALRDGAEETIDFADHVVESGRDAVQRVDEQRVEIERLEDALDDVGQVAFGGLVPVCWLLGCSRRVKLTEAYDQLQLSVDIRDRQVDLGDADLDTGVDRDQFGNIGIQVDVG